MIGTNAVMPGFRYGGMPYQLAAASMRLFSERALPVLQTLEFEPLGMPS